jgi:predicted DNA-binding protein (UPF0251 family)
LEEVALIISEFEAIRLAGYDGMYYKKAAASIRISLAIFEDILEQGRKKMLKPFTKERQ